MFRIFRESIRREVRVYIPITISSPHLTESSLPRPVLQQRLVLRLVLRMARSFPTPQLITFGPFTIKRGLDTHLALPPTRVRIIPQIARKCIRGSWKKYGIRMITTSNMNMTKTTRSEERRVGKEGR